MEIPQIMEDEPFDIFGLTKEQMSGMYAGDAVLDGAVAYQKLVDEDGILVVPCGSTLKTVYGAEFQVGDTVTLRCYNGQSKIYTVMGIVEEAHVGSGQFFILPEEELYGLYPEVADFTAYLNIHAKQDGDGLRRAVYDTVTDTRINVAALGDMVSQMEANLQGALAYISRAEEHSTAAGMHFKANRLFWHCRQFIIKRSVDLFC